MGREGPEEFQSPEEFAEEVKQAYAAALKKAGVGARTPPSTDDSVSRSIYRGMSFEGGSGGTGPANDTSRSRPPVERRSRLYRSIVNGMSCQ